MKVVLNKEMTELTVIGKFDRDGVPTAAAQDILDGKLGKDGKQLKGDANGLNHGSTGFPVPTGMKFAGEDGERELYVGINITSHLVKNAKAKPKF